MRIALALLSLCLLTATGCTTTPRPAAVARTDPQAALASLLAAERAFSDAAATRTPAEGIAAMMDDEVFFLARGGVVRSPAAVAQSLAANPSTRGRSASWRPYRAGISGDGQHGFTYGYLDIADGDPAAAHRRYLAYWIRRPQGWRVLAFRQVLRPATEQHRPMVAPLLPPAGARSRSDAAARERRLAAAELAFSDRAQRVGLRRAFGEFGAADAVIIYGETNFSIGPEAIGRIFPEATTSPLRWASDRTWVAASDDLGLSVGTLRANGLPTAETPAEQPYFTIWRRDLATGWRFIAE